MADKKIDGSLEITGKLNPNTSGYGILLPDTSTLTDDTSVVTSTSMGGKEDKSNKVTSLSSSSTDIQYPSAKAVYDLLSSKQDTLVSGTNIKTINGQTLLGSGDLIVSTDLSGYYTKTETDTLLSSKANSSDLADKLKRVQLYSDDPMPAVGQSIRITSLTTQTIESIQNADEVVIFYDLGNDYYHFYRMYHLVDENSYLFYCHFHTGTDNDNRYLLSLEGSSVFISNIVSAHDSTKQDTLVSGTNIKTIDGYGVLGSGDINLRYCGQVDSRFYRDAYFYLPNEWEAWLTAEPALLKTWDQFLNALGISTTATSIFVYVAYGDPWASNLYHTHAYMVTKANSGIYNNRAWGTLYTPFKTYYDADGVYMWSTYSTMQGTAIYSSNTSPLIKIAGIETPDLTNYYNKSETDTLLDAKQATLVSGTNIKTINNESILGSGNIVINDTWRNIKVNGTQKLGTGTDTGALDLQQGTNVTLSENSGVVTISATDTTYSSEAAAQGGTAVSLVTTGEKYIWNNKSDFSGSYNDLSSRPQINSVTLTGNKSLSDLGIQASSSLETDVAAAGFTKNIGTITGITMNGTSKGTSGVVDLGTVLTDSDFPQGQLDMTFNATGSSYSSSEQLSNIQVGTTRYLVPHVDTSWTEVGTFRLSTDSQSATTSVSVPTSSLIAATKGVTCFMAEIYLTNGKKYQSPYVFYDLATSSSEIMQPLGTSYTSGGQIDWELSVIAGTPPVVNIAASIYFRTIKPVSGGSIINSGYWTDLTTAENNSAIKTNLQNNYGFLRVVLYKKILTY